MPTLCLESWDCPRPAFVLISFFVLESFLNCLLVLDCLSIFQRSSVRPTALNAWVEHEGWRACILETTQCQSSEISLSGVGATREKLITACLGVGCGRRELEAHHYVLGLNLTPAPSLPGNPKFRAVILLLQGPSFGVLSWCAAEEGIWGLTRYRLPHEPPFLMPLVTTALCTCCLQVPSVAGLLRAAQLASHPQSPL